MGGWMSVTTVRDMTPSPMEKSENARRRILVVDDLKNVRATTAILLRQEGYTVQEASGGEEALAALTREHVDLVLTDLRMTPMDGLQLLAKIREVAPQTQVIVMTAFSSMETAVKAIKRGAYDYVSKPFQDPGELLYCVRRALERAMLLLQVNAFTDDFLAQHGLLALIGRSEKMRELTSRIVRVASSDATVLVQGESGTGKELVARAVHAQSPRKDRPFVPVNCAAISEGLLESELFGHAKGAFTGAVRARRGLFEEADGGTLFIDEVTETSPAFQSKLLRVLQDGEVRRVGESNSIRVNVRIVAATNRDIEAEVAEKRFRQDLFYRLNVVRLRVPPLRERLEDIQSLAEHFLKRVNARTTAPKRLTEEAVEHLQRYSFPGNVRELENLVEQAAALAETADLTSDDFPIWPKQRAGSASPPADGTSAERPPSPGSPLIPERMANSTLADAVAEAERRAISLALERNPRDLAAVAEELGISPTTLWRKMKRLGLKDPDPGTV